MVQNITLTITLTSTNMTFPNFFIFACLTQVSKRLGAHPGEGFGGRKPSLFEVKAMFLMADIINQLSNDRFHSGSNQTLKKRSSKIGHFCPLTLSEYPSLKISGCASVNGRILKANSSDAKFFRLFFSFFFCLKPDFRYSSLSFIR